MAALTRSLREQPSTTTLEDDVEEPRFGTWLAMINQAT